MHEDLKSLLRKHKMKSKDIKNLEDKLNEIEEVALYYLLNWENLNLERALEEYGDVIVHEGKLKDYAYEVHSDFVEEKLGTLFPYFDYEFCGKDMEIEGSIFHLVYFGRDYVVETNY